MILRRFPKCILHIGTEKTGTTTLQSFLASNKDRLGQLGFFVPMSLSPYAKYANHERLTTLSLRRSNLTDDLRRAAGLRSVDEVDGHRVRVRSDLTHELEAAVDLPDTLLLSNEHCHSRLVNADELETLRDFLAEFAESVEIFVYLRPQHELATSLYDQALKAGYVDISIIPSFVSGRPQWIEKRYFDYEQLVNRWAGTFGVEHVHPQIFQRGELVSESINADFLDRIGCSAESLMMSPNENVSISAALQPVLNAVNRYAKSSPAEVSPPVRARLIKHLQGMSQGSGRKPVRNEAVAFYDMFASGNDRICRQFFPERPSLFDLDFSGYPEHGPKDHDELSAVIKALLNCLNGAG